MVENLLEILIQDERQKLLKLAREILAIPLTDDDLLQPNDFPELETNPHFRYQEGIVIGLLTFQSAFRAMNSLGEKQGYQVSFSLLDLRDSYAKKETP